ncbi:MAG: TIGR03790 family protein, partial [Verrucomicrobiota bacterium]
MTHWIQKGLPGRFGPGLFLLGLLSAAAMSQASDTSAAAVVVYNSKVPESKTVAEYYAAKRSVPASQVFGFDLPKTEEISRADFRELLQKPLLKKLQETKLFSFRPEIRPATNDRPADPVEVLVDAKIRYAVLCYGVPSRILSDSKINEPGTEKLRPELRRNEAAVDTELALLPMHGSPLLLSGPAINRLYGVTNAADLHPTNGLLMVARLDGPTPEVARGLVDKALQAEAEGLWGRAYFDARGLTNSNYKAGDDWIKGAAGIARRLGFETVLDESPSTFSAGFPMSHIAFYAGWYDGHVSGPFTRPTVEFMPGAFAYHLHSFSANTIRSASRNWVGPLLDKGATATMGCVDEPYLEGTPDIAAFFGRFIFFGFSFGEAAYASQSVLSWQTTIIGDPLYRPFSKKAREQHEDLERRKSKLIDWSHLRACNLNLATDLPVNDVIDYLNQLSETRESPILLEKMGDLQLSRARFAE